jgi:hypothetical protein
MGHDLDLTHPSIFSQSLEVCRWSLRSGSLSGVWLNRVESYITTDGESASLSWNEAPIWDLRPDFLLLSDICGFVDVGHSLWREDGSVVYNCCWSSPAQSFSGSSPVGFVTIFYTLRFETSLFVASCLSQGSSGVIRPRLHTGLTQSQSQSQSHIATDGQSVSLGVEPSVGLVTRYLLLFDRVLFLVGRPFRREDRSVFCICCWLLPAQSFSGPSPLGLATMFYCLRFVTLSPSPSQVRSSRTD